MIPSEHDIFIQETEVKPNKYAVYVMAICVVMVVLCWILDEIGIFRVGKTEMRIGSAITFIVSAVPLILLLSNKKAGTDRNMKYVIVVASGIFTFSTGTLLTFHTTIMMLFPICIAMLYRSKKVGSVAAVASLTGTAVTPILGYVLGTWDIELFKELILIGTNGTAVIEGAYQGITWLNVGKIVLYLVLPRLMMIGSCTLLMFYVIRIGVNHVDNQIELFRISRRDALTGLFNQNCYKEVLENDSAAWDTVGVIFFDVNGLKAANDSQGHEMGDLLLKRSAKSILDVCDDETAYGFRLGGDEFVVVLPGGNESSVSEKISAWEEALQAVNQENERYYEGLQCSMAYGSAVGAFSRLEELTQLADKRMYDRKVQMKAVR